jgi:hypothetical protein
MLKKQKIKQKCLGLNEENLIQDNGSLHTDEAKPNVLRNQSSLCRRVLVNLKE